MVALEDHHTQGKGKVIPMVTVAFPSSSYYFFNIIYYSVLDPLAPCFLGFPCLKDYNFQFHMSGLFLQISAKYLPVHLLNLWLNVTLGKIIYVNHCIYKIYYSTFLDKNSSIELIWIIYAFCSLSTVTEKMFHGSIFLSIFVSVKSSLPRINSVTL